MTDQTNPQWDEWDNEASAELVEKYRDFGYPVLTGRVNRCATLDVHRAGEHVGYVDVDPSGIDWVIQTRRIFLEKPFRFDKVLHAEGKYQPRWGLFLMERVFDKFPDKEIRESSIDNDPLGDPFLARVRGEYAMLYHQPNCFLNDERRCACGVGRPRAIAS